MVWRERQEKVAQVDVMAEMVSRFLGMDHEKLFGGLRTRYAMEVFQETYSAERMRAKVDALRIAAARVKHQRTEHDSQMGRLEELGKVYDKKMADNLAKKK